MKFQNLFFVLFFSFAFLSSCEKDPFRQSFGEWGQDDRFINIEINDDGIKRRTYFKVDESGGGSSATFRGESGDYEIEVSPFVADRRCQRRNDGVFIFSTDAALIGETVKVCAWRD